MEDIIKVDSVGLMEKMREAMKIEERISGMVDNNLTKSMRKIGKWREGMKSSYDVMKKIRGIGASKERENKGIAAVSMAGKESGGGLGSVAMARASEGAKATATGGTRNTTVNINLGKMVENIVFNGTLGENAQALERQIEEILKRTLTMAAATA